MADATYVKAVDAVWQGKIDLLGGTINLALCTASYTPDTSSSGDEFLTDIPGGAIKATETLSGKSMTAGVFDADDVVFTSPPAGATITQAIIYQDASPTSGARLIRKITDATNLPITLDGSTFTFVLPNDVKKILRTRDV